jgi:hypothetical protein
VGSFILFGLKPHFALISSSILLICLLWALIYENILNSLYTWPIILFSLITPFYWVLRRLEDRVSTAKALLVVETTKGTFVKNIDLNFIVDQLW